MDFLKLAAERYSVRDYMDKPIEPEKLNAVLEAGRLAPTAKNNQPQKIFVLKSAEALGKIRAIAKCAFNAPTVFLICSDTTKCFISPDSENITSAEVDASIVATHMMLEATALGLGTCYVLRFDPEAVKNEFGLPQNLRPICLMPIGYPSAACVPSERHASRKPLGETVTEL